MVDTNVCRGCQEVPERADHVLLECGAYNLLRSRSFLTWNLDRLEPDWSVAKLLKFLSDPRIRSLEDDESQDQSRRAADSEDDE